MGGFSCPQSSERANVAEGAPWARGGWEQRVEVTAGQGGVRGRPFQEAEWAEAPAAWSLNAYPLCSGFLVHGGLQEEFGSLLSSIHGGEILAVVG